MLSYSVLRSWRCTVHSVVIVHLICKLLNIDVTCHIIELCVTRQYSCKFVVFLFNIGPSTLRQTDAMGKHISQKYWTLIAITALHCNCQWHSSTQIRDGIAPYIRRHLMTFPLSLTPAQRKSEAYLTPSSHCFKWMKLLHRSLFSILVRTRRTSNKRRFASSLLL